MSKFATVALVDIDSEEIQVYVKYFDITFIPSIVFFFNAHHMKMDSGYHSLFPLSLILWLFIIVFVVVIIEVDASKVFVIWLTGVCVCEQWILRSYINGVQYISCWVSMNSLFGVKFETQIKKMLKLLFFCSGLVHNRR